MSHNVVLCSGGYAGLIIGFFGGIFYIYKGVVKLPYTVAFLPSVFSNSFLTP